MIIAPVLITTLCRYEHFSRGVESLKRNSYAKDTELYIGLDYPAKEAHWDGYKKICEYLDKGVDGFKDVHIVRREKNLGSSENYLQMRKMIFEKHDRFIFSEDDNEFSVNYLEYMNKALERFEDSEKVFAVSGYMYPIDNIEADGNVLLLNTYFSAFGKGVYKRTEELFANVINMDTFMKMYRNVRKMRELRKASPNQYCNFVKGMVEYIPELVKNGNITRIDLAYGLYMFFYDYQMVFPKMSKVRNWGYDGSGTNCVSQDGQNNRNGKEYRNYNFSSQAIDQCKTFDKVDVISDMQDDLINQKINTFFKVPKKEECVTVLTYYLSLLIGRKRTAAIIKRLKKQRK